MSEPVRSESARTSRPHEVHEYVRVGSFYVNSSLDLVTLARYLWDQADQFLGHEGKSISVENGLGRYVPTRLLKRARVARTLQAYYRSRWKAGRNGDGAGRTLVLPIDGDLAVVRRSGAVKVLDVERRQVFTVVRDQEGLEKLRERVELSRSVSGFSFAPDIGEVHLEQGYFAEEFLSGSHPQNFKGCRDDFDEVYGALLAQFLVALPLRTVDARQYVNTLRDEILAPDSLLMEMSEKTRGKVTEFVAETCAQLEDMPATLQLALSHGDYFSGNIVIGDEGHKAIDWAHLGYRVPLHDLYYLYLNHCSRVLGPQEIDRRIVAAAEWLRNSVSLENEKRGKAVSRHLVPSDYYRRIFYLECIHTPLMRCSDSRDRYLTAMLERVSWFKAHEEARQASGVRRTPEVAAGPNLSVEPASGA